MGIFFIWFFIIFIIIIISSASSNKNKINNNYPNKYKEINSYYNDKKIKNYKAQELNHIDHVRVSEEYDKVCNDIGYKRCPKCESTVSKKSSECFMCGHKF